MLRALRQFWERYAASLPRSDVVDSIPESQWGQAGLRPAVSKARRKAFADLLGLIYAHLPREEAAALVKSGAHALDSGDGMDAALMEALVSDEDGEDSRSRSFIACDWKAAEEVPWQAERLCEAHRLPATWKAPAGALTEVLQSLDDWLQPQGHRLLCVSVGDSVVAFALRVESVAAAVALGKKLELALVAPSEG